MLDPRVRRRHHVRNLAQTLLLLGGMVAVLAAVAWAVFGAAGLLWAVVAGVVVVAFRPAVPPRWVLAAYRARAVGPRTAPELHRYLRVLAERACLPVVPALYYVASPMVNAFAVGSREDPAVVVTDGLLRRLTRRELVGVLAHEISHVRSGDLQIMTLSDTVGRITHVLAYAGVLVVLLTLPVTLGGEGPSPLWSVAFLTLLPTSVTLLQLALSRSREYDADLAAAVLTGDPDGLAAALEKLERHDGRIWERLMVPHRRPPDPLLLRTHPPTAERTRRLRELVRRDDRRWLGDSGYASPQGYPLVRTPARLRFPGVRW
ncbi:MAG TPA: zinc metalloprotease HtpX [Pseudonocardia sp.]|nr:zinc metalloprotease HtpX [Pseudonocardia sp.]